MLTEPLIQQLHTLRLQGMAQALEQQLSTADGAARSFEERLGLLIQHEITERANQRLAQRLRWAKLPQNACLEDLDIRTDVVRYRVFRNGELIDEPADIKKHWRDDLVIFALGCSFSFEDALTEDGIELRHVTENCAVSMYRTTIPTTPAGPFHGPLVVTMRPVPRELVVKVTQLSGRFPLAHGTPVQVGYPEQIGVDLEQPIHGDYTPLRDGEVPMFWACGVTPQAVAMASKTEWMITHAPAHMFLADRHYEEHACV